MVSGLVTSPCDQLRIRSGDAREMRMLSKSVMLLPRSNGLERYKVSSVSLCHSQFGMTEEPSCGTPEHAVCISQNCIPERRTPSSGELCFMGTPGEGARALR